MILSKSKGEKLVDKDMNAIYGGSCADSCGTCDCRSSNGFRFYSAFDPQMTAWDNTRLGPT